MKKKIYYLWRDTKNFCYRLTDSKIANENGKVWIDGYGWMDLILVFASEKKDECLNFLKDKIYCR